MSGEKAYGVFCKPDEVPQAVRRAAEAAAEHCRKSLKLYEVSLKFCRPETAEEAGVREEVFEQLRDDLPALREGFGTASVEEAYDLFLEMIRQFVLGVNAFYAYYDRPDSVIVRADIPPLRAAYNVAGCYRRAFHDLRVPRKRQLLHEDVEQDCILFARKAVRELMARGKIDAHS